MEISEVRSHMASIHDGPGNGKADTIFVNGNISTQDERPSFATAVALKGNSFVSVGSDGEVLQFKGPDTLMVDLKGRTVIPGLNDSHAHVIRGGLTYDAELRWDGVTSVSEAMRKVVEQAGRTPPGQWVRVIGGWSEYQFKERRKPTLEEVNRATTETPILITNLYHDAMLNRATLGELGYTKDTPAPSAQKSSATDTASPRDCWSLNRIPPYCTRPSRKRPGCRAETGRSRPAGSCRRSTASASPALRTPEEAATTTPKTTQ